MNIIHDPPQWLNLSAAASVHLNSGLYLCSLCVCDTKVVLTAAILCSRHSQNYTGRILAATIGDSAPYHS